MDRRALEHTRRRRLELLRLYREVSHPSRYYTEAQTMALMGRIQLLRAEAFPEQPAAPMPDGRPASLDSMPPTN